jgi:hypothetical protein
MDTLERLIAAAEASEGAAPARLVARHANLAARLEPAPPLAPARLRRYREKLALRIAQATLAGWQASIDAALAQTLTDALGMAPPEAWLREPYVKVLAGVCGLSSSPRALGLRLLRARLGPPPWDLRHEPGNVAFVQRMTRRGLDLQPWIDGIGMLERRAPKGQRVTLALEDDPIEVMRMGEPFETCLAPGAFNFFSAVTNAADLNKRVLYARSESGAIIGRCLLALTAAGGILTFHPYAHDHDLAFPAMVRDVVLDLAARMRAGVAAEGAVETLVAASWYDDGPVDLVGLYRFLEDGSAFCVRLAALEPVSFVPALLAELGAGGLHALALPRILALPELDRRPQLAVALGERLLDPDLTCGVRLRAAALARRAGERGLANTILATLGHRSGWRALTASDRRALAAELIALDQPERALQLLRLEGGEEDWDARTRELVARAFEALGRPHQALRLYREALPGLHDDPGCRARIEALAAALSP